MKDEQIQIRVSKKLKDDMKKIAKLNEISVSQYLIALYKEAVKNNINSEYKEF